MYGGFIPKFITGIAYQRLFNKWAVGVKYEHGLNTVNEQCKNCADALYGTAYLHEDNFYITSDYYFLSGMDAHLLLSAGIDLYYARLRYNGHLEGGFTGEGAVVNNLYRTVGVNPHAGITYFPTRWVFLSLGSGIRYGFSQVDDLIDKNGTTRKEWVVKAPELSIGFRF